MPIQLRDRAQATSPLPLYTTAEARMLGIRLSDVRWLRVRKGVYADRAAYAALPSWKRYAVRVHAFVRTHPNAVLCMESAGVLHGIPRFGETRDIHIYDPDLGHSSRHGDVSIHTSHDERRLTTVSGVRVTSMEDTILDLARVVPPAHALAMMDSAISPVQGGMLSLDDIRARGDRQQNQRGRARLRWVGEQADARSESPAESISRAVMQWSGFERPELQREFGYEGCVDRTDFYFASCRVIGEADGWGKYDLGDPVKAKQNLVAEKRREDRLRRNGHPFARWELRDAWQVVPLCDALTAAGVPRVAAPQPAMLATLRTNPRAKPWKPPEKAPTA